jgi:hypothetical protein
MKSLVSMIALALAIAVTGPAFAGSAMKASNKAECDKAGGMWDAQNNTCAKKGGSGY